MRRRDLTPIEARVLPFRRPAAAVRVRRRSLWVALGRPFLTALAVVGGPALLAAWTLTAPTFGLHRIEVEGNHYVETRWVEATLAPMMGENLPRLALEEVRRRLGTHPWVAGVTAEKRLPDRLLLRLEERQPAALLRRAGGLSYLDREGRVIAPFAPGIGPADLLLVGVRGGVEVDAIGALSVADELASVAPDWAATLSEVEVLGNGEFRLFLGALPFPLMVQRGTLAGRLVAFRGLLPELEHRYPQLAFVDLRSERRIVFQPVVERS